MRHGGESSHFSPPVISNHKLLHQDAAVLITHVHTHTHTHTHTHQSTNACCIHTYAHAHAVIQDWPAGSYTQRLLLIDVSLDYQPGRAGSWSEILQYV